MAKKEEIVLQAVLDEKEQEIAQLKAQLKDYQQMHEQMLSETCWYYENILALMPGHVYWLNANNVYLGCNNIQAMQAKLPSRDAIVGKRNADLPWCDQAEELDEFNRQVMMTGIASERIETATMSSGDGVYFSQKVPLYNQKGDVSGVLGVSIDITELMKKEAGLILAKKRAEESSRSKSEFIANMSHDIRTPLSGILGLSKLLADEMEQTDHRQYAQWIYESTGKLLGLVNEILDVASAEQQTQRLTKEVFDLRHCIAEIEVLERPTMIFKQLEFKLLLDEHIPSYILTDRIKLYRILLNLLGNAIKFTDKGFVSLEVRVIDQAPNRLHLGFTISDSGIGIPPEYQSKVFERFFRATASYGSIYAGSGVGLNIARAYVEKLGGDLTLTSQLGQGTTFRFSLWVDIPTPDMEPTVFETVPMMESISKSVPNHKYDGDENAPHILLVEDNTIALSMAEIIVKQTGCRSTSVTTAEDAFVLFQTQSFDLIISDVGLPGLSGTELTAKIREFERLHQKTATPVIGLTAHVDRQGRQACLAAGMNEVYSKPMTTQVLNTIIEQILLGVSKEPSPPTPEMLKREQKLLELSQFPLLDIESAVEYLGGETVLRDILIGFTQERIPNDLEELKEAYDKQDWYLLRYVAHKIRGGAVYVGATRIQYAAEYLESYENNANVALLELLYHQLLRTMSATREVALKYLNSESQLPAPDFLKKGWLDDK